MFDRHLELARQRNRPVIILLTDGKANPEPVETAVDEARRAKEAGVTIFVIGLGHPEDLDNEALRLIASRPDYYYQTPRAEELAAVYEEIAGVIPCPPEQFWGGRRTRTRSPVHEHGRSTRVDTRTGPTVAESEWSWPARSRLPAVVEPSRQPGW